MKKVTADRLAKDFRSYVAKEIGGVQAQLRVMVEIMGTALQLSKNTMDKIKKDNAYPPALEKEPVPEPGKPLPEDVDPDDKTETGPKPKMEREDVKFEPKEAEMASIPGKNPRLGEGMSAKPGQPRMSGTEVPLKDAKVTTSKSEPKIKI